MILGLDEDPEQLIAKLEFTCQTMVEELLTYGLLPNFNGGKTEAIVDPRGNGSTQLRRRIFTEGKGPLTIETPLPDQPPLKIVPRYKHLGGIITLQKCAQRLLRERPRAYRPSTFTETRSIAIHGSIYPHATWCCRPLRWLHCIMAPVLGPDLRPMNSKSGTPPTLRYIANCSTNSLPLRTSGT